MFNKLKGLVEEGTAAVKEKLQDSAEATVNQFLAELRTLRPVLAKANVKFGGYRLVVSVPPRFELISEPSMDWNVEFNESAFDGLTLSKYQEMIVAAIRLAFKFSRHVNANGFEVMKVDFELSVPPSVTIDIRPKDVALST